MRKLWGEASSGSQPQRMPLPRQRSSPPVDIKAGSLYGTSRMGEVVGEPLTQRRHDLDAGASGPRSGQGFRRTYEALGRLAASHPSELMSQVNLSVYSAP